MNGMLMETACVSGYYRYNAEGNRYYVPGDICQYEFDRVLQVVHRLQYQMRDEVGICFFVKPMYIKYYVNTKPHH